MNDPLMIFFYTSQKLQVFDPARTQVTHGGPSCPCPAPAVKNSGQRQPGRGGLILQGFWPKKCAMCPAKYDFLIWLIF